MSNRERWVIYPLLFFSFLLGIRDKYAPPDSFNCDSITCRRLSVLGADGSRLIALGASTDDAGVLRVFSAREPLVVPGIDEVNYKPTRVPGHEVLEIGSNAYGGYLRLFASRKGTDLQLGHDGKFRFSGLTAVDDEDYVPAVDQEFEPEVWGPVLAWPEEEKDREGEAPAEPSAPVDSTSGSEKVSSR